MKFIYILEDDERIQKDLFDTLQNIDQRLHIRFFENLYQFHEWLKTAIQVGAKALATGGFKLDYDHSEDIAPSASHELRLVIANNESLGTKNMNLVERARDFFIRKKMCSEFEPTALILTAFDSADFDISLAEKRIINNVIFKPFDKLILKQHIEYALSGRQPLDSLTVAAMKIHSTLEMLKELAPPSLSEIGFTTINNGEIKTGAIAKYYSESFKTDNKKSVFAYCKSCKPINEKEYLCEFRFFGIDNKQISQVRLNILQNKSHETAEIKNSHGKTLPILIFDEDQPGSLELKNYLLEKISNAEVYIYSNYSQLLSDLADKDTVHRQHLPQTFEIVFANYELFESEKDKRWNSICDYFKDRAKKYGKSASDLPKLYLKSKKQMQMDTIKELTSWASDLFFTPFDKSYLLKKILSQHSTALNKQSVSLASVLDTYDMKVANPVEITQISEAGLVLKYHRAMSIGSFREFILWRPNESETPEIIGTVNFTEKGKDQAEFILNHFVFFGMKDLYLKHIRLWLREAYIKSKDQN